MESKRAIIFIDGSNFYYRIKSLSQKSYSKNTLINFDFKRFFENLLKEKELVETRYYVGAVRRENNNPKSEELYANQQKLLASLQQKNIKIILGTIIRHPDKTYHEKGVDVRIAVEMIRFARENKYDVAYLISSDTDLVPAVEEVRAFGKEVCYVGVFKGQSFGLSKASNNVILLRSEEIEKFL
jgi:uncharacterized LabA/DUF88 family protein